MRIKLKSALCAASVITGMMLTIGAEGGEKAGSLSPIAGTSLLVLGLAMLAVPVAACWLSDRAEDYTADTDTTNENERSDAA